MDEMASEYVVESWDSSASRQEAERVAQQRNDELGEVLDQERYAIAVETADGSWGVEHRR